jgi:MFS family permease
MSFAALALVAASLRVDRIPSSEQTGASWKAATEGMRFIAGHARLRAVTLLVVLFVLALGVTNVAEIFFVTSALHAGPAAYGLLGLCVGCGALLAGALSGRLAARYPHPERIFVAGCALLCVAIFGFALSRTMVLAAALTFLIGVGNSLLNVNATLLFASSAPSAARGRVFAALQGAVSASSIGALAVGGALLAVASPSSILIGGALAGALALAVTFSPVVRPDTVLVESAVQSSAPK